MDFSGELIWSSDLLPSFEAATLHFPDDYDGPVVATIVRRRANHSTKRAVLYIHGYTDYFFQTHLADEFNARGYNFYALDLRKYGRSLGNGSHPCYCRDLHEYFPEISTALQIMAEMDANEWVMINAHSTGGLISSLYADHGPERRCIQALVLNSPFFAFNLDRRELMLIKTMAAFAGIFPFARLQGDRPVPYFQSIHADHYGEWSFDFRWRPLHGNPVYAGWLRAILRAHRQLRRGLTISCPVLVLHAAASVRGPEWHAGFQSADGILNVNDIREGSRYLGSNVTVREIKDGLHDLALSKPDVRRQVFAEMFGWLERIAESVH